MIIFNISGLVILLGAFAVGTVVQGLATGNWETTHGIGPLVCGPLALAVDLLYRSFHPAEMNRWRFLSPATGGQLMYIPAWIVGLLFIAVGIDALATGRGSRYVEHDRFLSESVVLLEDTVEVLEKIDTRVGWDAAQGRMERCRQRLQELGPFYRALADDERRSLDRKYGDRIRAATDGLQVQAARLILLPTPRNAGENVPVQ